MREAGTPWTNAHMVAFGKMSFRTRADENRRKGGGGGTPFTAKSAIWVIFCRKPKTPECPTDFVAHCVVANAEPRSYAHWTRLWIQSIFMFNKIQNRSLKGPACLFWLTSAAASIFRRQVLVGCRVNNKMHIFYFRKEVNLKRNVFILHFCIDLIKIICVIRSQPTRMFKIKWVR